jgi:antitoxin component of MazEF toxin-antitoxin module
MEAGKITVRVADDGTITVPGRVVRLLRLVPRQTVTIEAREGSIVLFPSPREKLQQAGQMLRDALAGVEWPEIESGREERCF